MQIIRTVEELRAFRANACGNVGFVPTMGALHAGHISLIKQARNENDIVIVSTFVNPTQFLPGEDYEKYPKNEEADIKICENLDINAMFIPEVSEIYTDNEPTIIAVRPASEILEGKTRPGHFDGVCMVLNKFFNIIRPNNVYMGKKDAQQLFIVQNMVKSFLMDINIVPCEIVRESDGLALSSRNAYLDEEEKMLALKISRSLLNASNLIAKGEISTSILKDKMLSILEPLEVDYIAFVNRNFEILDQIEPKNTIILVAAKVGKTRLIDNIWL
ncbi:pantoate--beta-alanine ligase [Campylobacter sp. JMF_15 NE4]|uniref:pantoate--beta-alanine ligase n=1 Tax=Campylobacter sp. JMF_15 NE4 TaxID=2983825 RepID=UPI0022E9BF71|nr:pantoate--beta-alanine ligase [Campylobacter sp. JMF_15 NE4]MDA3048821.1 pantoate--beta-alanine ligase [Campylobacter sp. JMF_15 NE4]